MSTAAGAGGGRDDTGRGKKRGFEPHVVEALKEEANKNSYPSKERKLELCSALGLTVKQVDDWMKNYRRKLKDESSNNEHGEAIGNAFRHVLGSSSNAQYQINLPLDASYLQQDLDLNAMTFSSNGQLSLNFDLHADESTPPPTLDLNVQLLQINHSSIMKNAEQELMRLIEDDNMWQTTNGRQLLNLESYNKILLNPNRRFEKFVEASRVTFEVKMEPMKLAWMLTSLNEWLQLFPTIVSRAVIIEEITPGVSYDNPDGSLRIMYKELQVTSPSIPNPKFIFHRNCKQMDGSTWLIVDASFEPSQGVTYRSNCCRLPSGCQISKTDAGFSKVIWVEHLEVDAYGAERWAACLERACDRIAHENEAEQGNVMNLSKGMVRSFFSGMNAMTGKHFWGGVLVYENMKTHVSLRRARDPNCMIVTAATSAVLPYAHDMVFSALTTEQNRAEWDILHSKMEYQKLLEYKTGAESGNNIRVFEVGNEEIQPIMALLEECSKDKSGSHIAWSTLRMDEFNLIQLGEDDQVEFIPSGFSVSPIDTDGSSLITFVIQMMVNKKMLSDGEVRSMVQYLIGIVNRTFLKVQGLLQPVV